MSKDSFTDLHFLSVDFFTSYIKVRIRTLLFCRAHFFKNLNDFLRFYFVTDNDLSICVVKFLVFEKQADEFHRLFNYDLRVCL